MDIQDPAGESLYNHFGDKAKVPCQEDYLDIELLQRLQGLQGHTIRRSAIHRDDTVRDAGLFCAAKGACSRSVRDE